MDIFISNIILFLVNLATLVISVLTIRKANSARRQWEALDAGARSVSATANQAIEVTEQIKTRYDDLKEAFGRACFVLAAVGRVSPPLPFEVLKTMADKFLTEHGIETQVVIDDDHGQHPKSVH